MKTAALLPLVVLGVCAATHAGESTPAFPVPVRPLGFDMAAPVPPVAVTGLDVIAPDGKPLAPPLRLREDGAYTLRVFAKYTESAGTMPLDLSVVLDSGGPFREAAVPVKRPSDGMNPVALELPLRLEPGQGAGESVLRITAKRADDPPPGVIPSWPLAVLPAFVEPVPARSTLDARRVAEVFGENAVLLDARFRLGKGASLELAVPEKLAGVSVRAVGVVSSLAWLPRQDRGKSGLMVAQVETASADGTEMLPLRLGVETLQVDHDAFAKNLALSVGDVKVFSEWTQGAADKAQTRRNYAAICPLKSPRPMKSVTVRHAGSAAVIQVDGVLLLPAQ